MIALAIIMWFAANLWALALLISVAVVIGALKLWYDRRPDVIARRRSEASLEEQRSREYEQIQALISQISEALLLCVSIEPNPFEKFRSISGHHWVFGSDPESSRPKERYSNFYAGHGARWNGADIEYLSNDQLRECLAELKDLQGRSMEFEKQLLQIPTSSNQYLIGRRIAKQIRMVRVDNCDTDDRADLKLRAEAHKAGGNGIINMKVRPYPGGRFSAQGDAVIMERV